MTNKEKDTSIDYILSQGLAKSQTVHERVSEMVSVLGFRFIFWDMSHSIAFTVPTLVLTLLSLFFVPEGFSYSAAIGIAPILFLLITFFTETSERIGGLYELKQTCRYTIRQITAIRMMCYSLAGVLFTAVIAAITSETVNEFFVLLPICLSALFICATASLSAIRFLRNEWSVALISLGWLAFSLAIPFTLREQWELFLRGFPAALGIGVAVLCAAVFVLQIRKMLMEVNQYAVA